VENNVVSTPETGDFQLEIQKSYNSGSALESLKPLWKGIKPERQGYPPDFC